MKPTVHQLILTTCPDDQVAETIARGLVDRRLAACVNILPTVRSIYRWQGAVESSEERLLFIKARSADYPAIERRIRELHPYDVPEVIAISIENGLPAYLAWLEAPDEVT